MTSPQNDKTNQTATHDGNPDRENLATLIYSASKILHDISIHGRSIMDEHDFIALIEAKELIERLHIVYHPWEKINTEDAENLEELDEWCETTAVEDYTTMEELIRSGK